MRILPMGATAVIVEDPPGGPAAWSLGLRGHDEAGIVEVVPAATTVLVVCDSPSRLAGLVGRLPSVEPAPVAGAAETVRIPVRYDGVDLDDVATLTGLEVERVVELHAGADYTVAFCGFAPGFAYLAGLPAELHLPRRATPRTRVPAGSVAIAAEYSAVYPGASPGGWHLIGRTDLVMFDPEAADPSLLVPGTPVRFLPS